MFHVVLVHPEIPPNTGNAMRLAANTGVSLHLIEPLGFEMDDARLRRAGMDYRDKATVHVHPDLDAWFDAVRPERTFALAKAGTRRYDTVEFRPGDALMFGRESVGLSADVLADPRLDTVLSIPMRPGVRSLNLSNSVAVVVFEAWRQTGFHGAD
ncbi:MAG: tRNA (cytidine(34)-2'-O)-methyltransferase [Acidimicrobiia bacterium]